MPFPVRTQGACPVLAAHMLPPLLQPLNLPFHCCAYNLIALNMPKSDDGASDDD